MSSYQTPLTQDLFQDVPAVAAAADATTVVARAPFAGTVTAVTYAPKADITGANTETRTVSLVNKGTDGNGTTVIATLAMVSGVNSADFDEKTITVSVTAANLVIAAGDILAWTSVHSGSTGLADPGGAVVVSITRT
jgi:hypothetical protein